ncbi:TPA: McrC family protein [Enterobacter soli]|jgi:5-methylcytosine-specific restriction enzyme subunit McrC|uniref:McrC family protein n=2 Tax=Enterobacter TaxID=547 RepID=UPI0023798066|nr:restriction endonuclease [Enterobacter soli]MDD9242968.1 restriction endonuclease [Enterobacter soli]
MTPGRYWTIFEHGHVVSEDARGRVEHAVALPDTLFQWLVQRCLSDNAEYDSRLLTLRAVGRVQALQVKNYVGVIALPGGSFIEVLPKTGNDNAREQLMMMLRTLKTFRHIATTSASIQTSRMPLMDIFIQQFISSVQTILQQGIKRDYLRQQDNLAWMKGKLRVSAQLTKNSVRRDRFQVEYDEYSVDRPENRLLKTAIDNTSRLTRNAELVRQLQSLRSTFETIPPVIDAAFAFSQVRLDRHMHHYEQALDWAKLILLGESPHCMQGQANAISLLFPMEAVFESFVAAWMRHHHNQHYRIDTQAKARSLARYHTKNMFRLKPDIWLRPHNDTTHSAVICDTKWKKIKPLKQGFNISQHDLYQMQAYGMKYLDSRGDMLLIYPEYDGFSDALPHPFELHNPEGHELRLWVVPFTIGTSIQKSTLCLPKALSL